MGRSDRILAAALTAALLSACAEEGLVRAPGGPLTQQDVSETITSISEQLETALLRAAEDEGVVALSAFPNTGMMSNPFFGYGVTVARARHPERARGPLRALATYDLPTGVYSFREQDGSETWVLERASDDLTLNWTYDKEPETSDFDAADATLTFDWDARSPTTEVDSYGEAVEVPTGLNLTLLADGVDAADLDVTTSYYRGPGCEAGILEPTSFSVDGSGSFLALENVGYSVNESDAGDSFLTQGKVTLVDSGILLGWNLAINGDLERSEDCYGSSLSLGDGSVAVELAGLSGDTRSVALRFAFDDLDGGSAPVLSDGAVVVNGDEDRAVTFSGSLDDRDFDGIPGDTLRVNFPDGSSNTLEDLLTDWFGDNLMQQLRRK